jgi:hypothetical protein
MSKRVIGCGTAGAVFFMLLLCMGFDLPFDVGFNFLCGWALFLGRVLPQVRVDPGQVVTALVCAACLAGGLHLFLRWLHGQVKGPGEMGGAGRRWAPRWTMAILGLVVLMFVAGIAAVGMTHQTSWLLTSPEPLVGGTSTREMAARSQSANNLKQLGLAAANYESDHKYFPPGGTMDAQGKMGHGWQTLLLPYLEEEPLYKRINLQVPWDHPDNAGPFHTVVVTYQIQAARAEGRNAAGYALSHYAANAHVLGGDVPVTLAALSDQGTANTILAGEAAGNFKPWGHPANWRDPARGINRTPDGFGNPSRRGAQFVFADGSVRSFRDDADPEFLRLLSLPGPKK